MHTSALLLLALKGTCALNCLAALHLAGPQPLTQRAVMDLTGFDDRAVRKGLHTLLVLGLVTCTGDDHHTAWQLAPAAQHWSVPLAPVLPIPQDAESGLLFKKEEEEEKVLNSDLSSSPSSSIILSPADRKRLVWQFLAAFEAGDVYLKFRRSLAEALTETDGPAWLRQSLGWICYAQRRLPHVKRGAVVFISLRDRLPCDPAYLPPPELPFEAALAWALRGGEDARDEPAALEAPAPVPPSPQAQVWGAVLERLGREVPASITANHLAGVRVVSLDDERCVLAAASPQSRAWLANRLSLSIARALRAHLGREITVEFISD